MHTSRSRWVADRSLSPRSWYNGNTAIYPMKFIKTIIKRYLFSTVLFLTCRSRSGIYSLPQGCDSNATGTSLGSSFLLYAAHSWPWQPGSTDIFFFNVISYRCGRWHLFSFNWQLKTMPFSELYLPCVEPVPRVFCFTTQRLLNELWSDSHTTCPRHSFNHTFASLFLSHSSTLLKTLHCVLFSLLG